MTLLDFAGSALDRIGLRKTQVGRNVIAQLNVIGERGARLLYLSRKTPFTIDGHLLYLSERNAPSLNFVASMVGNRYERETKQVLERIVRPGATVLDIGAHVGHYALMAARLAGPAGRVFAFEAEPDNFSLLRRNVVLNGYENISCVGKAVSDHSGVLPFYVSHQGNDRHTIVPNQAASQVEVPCITIDDYADSVALRTVDAVKMDIEGAEPQAVRGMARLLGRSPRVAMIIEFAPSILRAGGEDPVAFIRQIAALGFEIEVIEPGFANHCLESPSLLSTMEEIERRGAVNLLCSKRTV